MLGVKHLPYVPLHSVCRTKHVSTNKRLFFNAALPVRNCGDCSAWEWLTNDLSLKTHSVQSGAAWYMHEGAMFTRGLFCRSHLWCCHRGMQLAAAAVDINAAGLDAVYAPDCIQNHAQL